MKKINWKILNFAFWIEVVLSYVLPFQVIDNAQYRVGFPVPFISVSGSTVGVNPLMSMSLNPLGLLFNGVLIYLVLAFAMGAYQRIKQK